MGIKSAVNKVLNHVKMVNPFHSLLRSGTSIFDAPGGSWKLSDDPKTNMALWNAIYTAGPAFGLAYLINNIANQRAESKIEDASEKRLIDKLQAMRPRLLETPKPIADDEGYEEVPTTELKRLSALKNSLQKSAKKDTEDDPDTLERAKHGTLDIMKGGIVGTLPIAVALAMAAGGVAASNKYNKERIKANLRTRRSQIRSIQALIDRERLIDKGLVKSAAKKDKDEGSDIGVLDAFVGLPAAAHTAIALSLGLGTYGILSAKDENKNLLKYLEKVQLGSNVLQDTPQLSVLDLPADPGQILAVPGDKKKETLLPTAATAANPSEIIDVEPIDAADIITEVKADNKKKDALFA